MERVRGEWDERLRAIVRCAFLFVYTLQRLLPKETAHCHESAEAISLCDAACAPIVRRPPRRPPCWCSIIARSSWPSSLFERLERVRLPIGAFDDDESAVDGGAKVTALVAAALVSSVQREEMRPVGGRDDAVGGGFSDWAVGGRSPARSTA